MQHAVEVKYGEWSRLNLTNGGEFRANNLSIYGILVVFSDTPLVGKPTQADLKRSWPVAAGDYLQRPAEAGVMEAFATLAEQPAGANTQNSIDVIVVEPA